jgi:hypothetical protein
MAVFAINMAMVGRYDSLDEECQHAWDNLFLMVGNTHGMCRTVRPCL